MACCLSPGCCPGRRSARRPSTKSVAVDRRSKSTAVAASAAAEQPTTRTSTVVPDVVDRLRRRLCQDDGSGTDSDGATRRRTPCRCCRHCLGEGGGRPVASSVPEQSPLRPPRSSPTPSKPVASGTTPGTTEVGDADFMTVFFRNCERIVLDNANAIHEMLSTSAPYDADEQRDSVAGDWTSNKTEPSSSANTVEQRRRISDDDDDVYNCRSDVASATTEGELHPAEDAGTSTPCGGTVGSVERLVAPANSPVSPGSPLTSSFSDDVLLTTRCVCSVNDVADDGLFVLRRPSVSGQSPAAVKAVNSTADRCRSAWRKSIRHVRTPTDDKDDGYFQVVVNRKSSTNRMTSFPVGLGSRPPCLGQECSPVRSTPCGAGRDTGSSAATGAATSGTPSGSVTRPVVQPGRVDLGRVAAFGRRRRRRSVPSHRRPSPLPDVPSPAALQQSYTKVNTWLRRHAEPETENDDVAPPVSGRGPTPKHQLKRKLIRREVDSAGKRRVTDSDSCSLPSGTFTSDDEEDETDNTDDANHAGFTATKNQSTGRSVILPAAPTPPPYPSTARPRLAVTSPRWKKRSPLVVSPRRRRSGRYGEGELELDVSSGVLGDRSSSLATSGDLAPCRRHQSTVCRSPTSAKTAAALRKNAAERRRAVLRRVTRMARRLHRVAAADAASGIHVQTLAVL